MYGVLRLIVTLDGENVVDCEPILGYLHIYIEGWRKLRKIEQFYNIYLMCLELILNVVNIHFVPFSDFFDNRQLKGEILSIFVIAIAAAEAAIVSAIYRNRKSTRINESNLLSK
uniref:NADH-plastoquinone oxidoreductase subunit 4L n=5 Tax=Gentiana TaxID=21496 RepID=A0A8F5AN02_9GENT|nr:NADH-plastoquinone oxidoreductase subunit 4L [Gentiana tetraphylla]QXI85725.1 NADH-plastoquinone oxidoreductase subunit 4L [Gentiana futtereri]QXI86052.1 NADH-plastoquinone oxidoreductase subunit 4L [Gentiana viatrix]QXI86212.1 NADH-plastoquinone oxidoreductase subunit 4L [Gentiana dolichocalyx]